MKKLIFKGYVMIWYVTIDIFKVIILTGGGYDQGKYS